MRFILESTGSYQQTEARLRKMLAIDFKSILASLGQEGADALASATPVETSLASKSWGFEVTGGRGECSIWWTNHDIESGFPVVIQLQYGHGTGTGGYVQGRDFINPAIRPIFDQIADKAWKAVTSV